MRFPGKNSVLLFQYYMPEIMSPAKKSGNPQKMTGLVFPTIFN